MLDENFKGKEIPRYKDCICEGDPDFIKQTVNIINTNLNFQPWDIWNNTSAKASPVWWEVYNAIKHDRTGVGTFAGTPQKENYKFANLEYCLNALAGLYQLLMHIYLKLANIEGHRFNNPSRVQGYLY